LPATGVLVRLDFCIIRESCCASTQTSSQVNRRDWDTLQIKPARLSSLACYRRNAPNKPASHRAPSSGTPTASRGRVPLASPTNDQYRSACRSIWSGIAAVAVAVQPAGVAVSRAGSRHHAMSSATCECPGVDYQECGAVVAMPGERPSGICHTHGLRACCGAARFVGLLR
jgi:hypothetical protein